jgi:hypothetical protein
VAATGGTLIGCARQGNSSRVATLNVIKDFRLTIHALAAADGRLRAVPKLRRPLRCPSTMAQRAHDERD